MIFFWKQLHFRHADVVTSVSPKGELRRILKDNPVPCLNVPSQIKRRKSKQKELTECYIAVDEECVEFHDADFEGDHINLTCRVYFGATEFWIYLLCGL